METKNSLVKKTQKETFSTFITGNAVKGKINQMLTGKDGARFITAIVSAVSNNPALAECDHSTILSAALIGESLKLSPSSQLGQYYLVPFNDSKNNRKVATFQIGYKGYIQLAIRSGQYRKINVIAVKEGELIKFDALNEEIEVNLIEEEEKREEAKTAGYYAMFEYVNGFRKAMYWSRKKMEVHALKYSKGYAAKKGYTFWEKDFDGMAYKTMLRQLISKWGVMSVEMEKAIEKDQAVIGEDGKIEYVDNGVIDNAVEVKNEMSDESRNFVPMQEDAAGNVIGDNPKEEIKEEFFERGKKS
jgi:recombination protein RecT